jgi:hypothetical protein
MHSLLLLVGLVGLFIHNNNGVVGVPLTVEVGGLFYLTDSGTSSDSTGLSREVHINVNYCIRNRKEKKEKKKGKEKKEKGKKNIVI